MCERSRTQRERRVGTAARSFKRIRDWCLEWFLRGWSGIEDTGARTETSVACHLLKAVEGWTCPGLGTFELRYLRDKPKREVDSVVAGDRKAWVLVEVKNGGKRPADSPEYLQARAHASLDSRAR